MANRYFTQNTTFLHFTQIVYIVLLWSSKKLHYLKLNKLEDILYF